jgi:hypothetical protein
MTDRFRPALVEAFAEPEREANTLELLPRTRTARR